MAKLPTRESLGALPSVQRGGVSGISIPSQRFSDISSGATALSRGIASIGTAADAIVEHQRKQETFDSERRFQEFTWNEQLKLDQSMRSVQPGQADKFQDQWQQDYIKSAGDFLKTVPDHSKAVVEQKLFAAERTLYGAAATFARTEQKRFAVNSIGDATDNIYQPRARISTTEELPQVTGDLEQLVNANPHLTPIERDEQLRKGRRAIGLSHLEAQPPERVKALSAARTQPGDVSPEGLLRRFEGFRERAYWDVNAYRVGYGSDTVTRADGTIEKVTPQTVVSKEDAERDLARRTAEFGSVAARQVGEQWAAMPDNVKAALTSVAYNYGRLPGSVVSAVKSGDTNALAQAVRELPANRSRRAQEADVILGVSPNQPSALAALTDEDWHKAETAAQTRATKQSIAVAETFERHIIDAISGRTALPDRASIESDPHLDEPRRNKLLSQHDAASRSVLAMEQAVARLNDPNAVFNPHEKDDRNIVDALYNQLGANDEALKVVVERTKMVPKAVANSIRGGITSNDPKRVEQALTQANYLLGRHQSVFAGLDGRKEIEEAVIGYRHMVENLGFQPSEATKRIVEQNTPEYQAKVKARIKGEDINEIVKKNLSINDVRSAFDDSVMGWRANPQAGFEPEQRHAMYGDYEELFREHYLKTGDISLSKTLATDQLKKVWGVSQVSGGRVVMRYPPERAPAYSGVENPAELIATQAVKAVKDETGHDVTPDKLRFLPVSNATAAAFWNGQPPPYLLAWQDKNGLVQTLNPGRAFVADPKAMRESRTQQRRTAFENAVAGDRASAPLRNETMAPFAPPVQDENYAGAALPKTQPPTTSSMFGLEP